MPTDAQGLKILGGGGIQKVFAQFFGGGYIVRNLFAIHPTLAICLFVKGCSCSKQSFDQKHIFGLFSN